MNKRVILSGLMASWVTLSANAGNIFYDHATVIEAEPIVRTIRISVPREECWDEEVSYHRSRRGSGLATVVGGIIGGAIGNELGHHKRNKQVGAVVGAVLGATVGNAMSANSRSRDEVRYGIEERCQIHHDYHEEERIVGYRVRYRYHDETFSTRTETDPGETIRVRIAVSPVFH